MISVAICDSQENGRQELLRGCQLAQERLHLPIACQVWETGEALLEGLPRTVDIILMDTRLEGMDGLGTARDIREANTAV